MKRTALRIGTIAAAATLVAFSASDAQTCGGNNFATCASVNISATLQSGTTYRIVMQVTNNSGTTLYPGTVFTAIDLHGLGAFSYVNGSLVVTGQTQANWALGTAGLSGAGIQPNVAGVSSVPPPVQTGLLPGQSVTLQFDITLAQAGTINTGNWAIHGQAGPNGCSTKLVVTNGVANNGPFDPACSANVVPEPATLALVGSGLVGMFGAGAAARRRRKR